MSNRPVLWEWIGILICLCIFIVVAPLVSLAEKIDKIKKGKR